MSKQKFKGTGLVFCMQVFLHISTNVTINFCFLCVSVGGVWVQPLCLYDFVFAEEGVSHSCWRTCSEAGQQTSGDAGWTLAKVAATAGISTKVFTPSAPWSLIMSQYSAC